MAGFNITDKQRRSLKDKRYPAVWAWGWYCRSDDYYMERVEAKAIEQGAPKGAYRQEGGFGDNREDWRVWQSDVANPQALDYLRDVLDGIESGPAGEVD